MTDESVVLCEDVRVHESEIRDRGWLTTKDACERCFPSQHDFALVERMTEQQISKQRSPSQWKQKIGNKRPMLVHDERRSQDSL
jgi:hypothetical protein